MPKQDYLIQLISTLSAAEKRSFYLYAGSLPADKRYLNLFEILQDKQQYDVKELCRETGLTPKQLVDDKYYLGQVLLKSLRNSEENESRVTMLLKDMQDAMIFYNRHMVEHALTVYDKVLEDARHFEILSFVPMVLEYKRACLNTLGRFDDLPEVIEQLSVSWEIQKEYETLWGVCSECINLDIKRKYIDKLDQLRSHPLMKKKPEALLSLKAASCWFNIEQRAYSLLNDHKNLLLLTRRMAAFYSSHPQLLDVDPTVYVMGHISLAQVEVMSGNYREGLKVLAKLEQLLKTPPKYLSQGALQKSMYYILHTKSYVLRITQKYDEAVAAGEKLYTGNYPIGLYERYDMIFELALSLMHAQRPSEAYEKLDELVQIKEEVWSDIQPYVRLIIILCQLDLENFEVVPYMVRTTKAWLKRQKISNPEFELFLHHTYVIGKAKQGQRKPAWQKMLDSVEKGKLKNFDEKFGNMKEWVKRKV
jgi:tetratricopeptide (TPR) repeat protein